MSTKGTATPSPTASRSHTAFSLEFVYAAMFLALTAGFGFAVVLTIVSSVGLPMGSWWLPLLQAHGHAQLWGWTGLLIMGVSLHFVPRLVGIPLNTIFPVSWICWLLFSGVLFRSVAQPLSVVFRDGVLNTLLRCGLGYAAIAELAAVAGYVTIMTMTLRSSRSMKDQEVLHTFRFYLVAVLCGWISATTLNSVITIQAALINPMLLDIYGTHLATKLYVGLVLLPVTMVFSIRTFPLYLRLPAARWPVRLVGLLYLCGFGLELIPDLWERLQDLHDKDMLRMLSGAGRAFKGLVLLWFIWELNILLRRKAPWTEERAERVVHHVRKQPRAHLPDYGEFGRFEWLLYSAYGWLAVGAGLDIVAGCAGLGLGRISLNPDAILHIYLAGFIMLLLLGMAPRMIPGFMRRRALAFPGLVAATFWLGNGAVVCRVLPVVIPSSVIEQIPGGPTFSNWAFGLSGTLGLLAILLLAWNLTATCGFERGRIGPAGHNLD